MVHRESFQDIWQVSFSSWGMTLSVQTHYWSVMPGSGALEGISRGVIKAREDFQRYLAGDSQLVFGTFGSDYELLRAVMPPGMKAIGGPGNGSLNWCRIVGFEQLCYIRCDDRSSTATSLKK